MKRFLGSPAVNAVCISLFTAFYGAVFLTHAYVPAQDAPFWPAWSAFLAAGHQRSIAYTLIAATALIVLLLVRRRPYDEYHAALLARCLIVSIVLTLIAIALFYLLVLSDPQGIVEKFTLFIVLHWATVVFSNLAYVLLCRRG